MIERGADGDEAVSGSASGENLENAGLEWIEHVASLPRPASVPPPQLLPHHLQRPASAPAGYPCRIGFVTRFRSALVPQHCWAKAPKRILDKQGRWGNDT